MGATAVAIDGATTLPVVARRLPESQLEKAPVSRPSGHIPTIDGSVPFGAERLRGVFFLK